MMTTEPLYLALGLPELRRRAERAVASLADCRACPRDCRVDRLHDAWSACKTGRYAVVSSAFPHRGEEDCLRGWNGSGTIFFAHCNLRCVFCQNHDISQGVKPGTEPGIPPETLAGVMLELQRLGCHNINFVTPEHVVPQILEALPPAVERGLRLPIVYNTSAYDSLESLELLDGVVDVYMPDFKVWNRRTAKRQLKVYDYPDRARAAIREMHRQVGDLVIGEDGLAVRGLLVRHLVMPGGVGESWEILNWLAETVGPHTYVNVMGQYRPAGKVSADAYPELDRPVEAEEVLEAMRMARDIGLRLDRRG